MRPQSTADRRSVHAKSIRSASMPETKQSPDLVTPYWYSMTPIDSPCVLDRLQRHDVTIQPMDNDAQNDAQQKPQAAEADPFAALNITAAGCNTDATAAAPKPSKADASKDKTPNPRKKARRASNRANTPAKATNPRRNSKQPATNEHNADNICTNKNTARTRGKQGGGSKGGKESPPDLFGFDLSTVDGRKQRFEAIANNKLSKDADVIRALASLEAIYKEEAASDPNAKLDPAEVCAYLARQHLYGLDPGAVLLERYGLRRVASAIGKSLGLAHVSLVLGDDTGVYDDPGQCLQCVSTDTVCAGGGESGNPGGEAPPRADS